MSGDIATPAYFRVSRREAGTWYFWKTSALYNPTNRPYKPDDVLEEFGVTKKGITIEFFKINAGRAGYYLADLMHKKYYYCGCEKGDIKAKLRELGIGCADP